MLTQIYQRNYVNPLQGRPKGLAMAVDPPSEERKSYFNYVKECALLSAGR